MSNNDRPAFHGEREVVARLVGSFDLIESLDRLAACGLFAFGRDQDGSGVFRFVVDAANDDEARLSIARVLLSIPGAVPHDVRVGGDELATSTLSEEDLEAQLDSLVALLPPNESRELITRFFATIAS